MGAFLELLEHKPALWLDSHAYCERLLAGGRAPWLDVAAFVAWQRKAQGLLRPDVAVLPLAPAMAAWLEAHPELRAAMAAKARPTWPLKTLLADTALRAHLVELARGLRAGVAAVPLALVLPAPRAWLAQSYQQAHGGTPDLDDDAADSASVYLADFLRSFGEAGVDALLLQEAADFAPRSEADFACYQSVLNVAAHYRWDVGVELPGAAGPVALPGGCAFAIAGGTPVGAFRYARIAVDAQPEAVLERLATLR